MCELPVHARIGQDFGQMPPKHRSEEHGRAPTVPILHFVYDHAYGRVVVGQWGNVSHICLVSRVGTCAHVKRCGGKCLYEYVFAAWEQVSYDVVNDASTVHRHTLSYTLQPELYYKVMAFDIQSLMNRATRLFGGSVGNSRGASSVLGLDIGTASIKLVQLGSANGAALLETYGEIELGPFGDVAAGESVHLKPEQLAEAIKQLVEGAGVTTRVCGVSVPFGSSLVKLIDLPPLDDKQLATVVPIEARKYVPVAIEEVQLDWLVIPETEQRLFDGAVGTQLEDAPALTKRSALIVAMHKSLLERQAKTLELAGIVPQFFEIEAFSSMRATIDRSLSPVALIDIGASSTKLYVVELGIVLTSHVVQHGAQDITQRLATAMHVSTVKAEALKRQTGIATASYAEPNVSPVSHAATLSMEQIFSETRRVLAGFQQRYNKTITKVVLSGGGASLAGLEEFARKQFELDVDIAKPFTRVQVPTFLEDMLRTSSPGFSGAVGLALRGLIENS